MSLINCLQTSEMITSLNGGLNPFYILQRAQQTIMLGWILFSSSSFGNLGIEKSDQGTGLELVCPVESGFTYQLQRSSDLTGWADHGIAFKGQDSDTLRIALDSSESHRMFYRFIRALDYGNPEDWIGGAIGAKLIDPNQLSGDASGLYTIISSKAFVYLTGTLEQAYHEPVGEVANYFGFAALRNEIRDRDGPQADQGFRGASWFETLEILNVNQRQILYDLITTHEPFFSGFFDTRIELIDELWVVKLGGSINIPKALALGKKMGRDEAELTVTSTKAYVQVMDSLTDDQIQAFEDIRSGATSVPDMSIPGPNTAEVTVETAPLTNQQRDILVAIGSKFIPWITGTVEGAVELPPGKITNYFGFAYYRYVDRANVSRSDAASKLQSVLTDDQRAIIAGLAEDAVTYSNAYIDGREALIRGYYPLRSRQDIDHDALVETYVDTAGIGETQRGIIEALTFAVLESQISEAQTAELISYRSSTAE